MLQISGTVTVGNGSEVHNHDRQYRSTLKQVIAFENDVIELITKAIIHRYEKNSARRFC